MSHAEGTSTDWRIGTMGFGYADWRGVFYPKSLKPNEYLAFYSKHLNALEIDTTFHAVPPPERFRKWAAAVPNTFRFAVKTPRAITHEAVIADSIAPMRAFLDVARHLGEKLGPILIQYPPALPGRVWPQVERFLDSLPNDLRFAVEFRHESWRMPEVAEGLRARKIALVNAEYEVAPVEPTFTTDFAYVRLVGRHGRYEPMNHERYDPTEQLKWWHERLISASLKPIYLMINNDFAGYAIGTSDRLHRLLGQSVESPAQRMGTLF
jgi:uncharacterized protein YecE (DUF72 family)